MKVILTRETARKLREDINRLLQSGRSTFMVEIEGKPIQVSPAKKRTLVTKLLTDPKWRGWSSRRVAKMADVSPILVCMVREALGLQRKRVTYLQGNQTRDMDVTSLRQRHA